MNGKGCQMARGMPKEGVNKGADMIIFAITFAILGLFGLTLTGSIATATRRR